MATRCPACGEFIGDNTFGKHNCGKAINWNAVELASTDAEIARLNALLAEAREGLEYIADNPDNVFDEEPRARGQARVILAKLGA